MTNKEIIAARLQGVLDNTVQTQQTIDAIQSAISALKAGEWVDADNPIIDTWKKRGDKVDLIVAGCRWTDLVWRANPYINGGGKWQKYGYNPGEKGYFSCLHQSVTHARLPQLPGEE